MTTLNAAMTQPVWAVVGATPRREKFGYKIFKRLADCGKKVYPIHPAAKTIDGIPCYRQLEDLPEVPQVVNLVVGPEVGKRVVETCARIGVPIVWLQPGADAPEVVRLAQRLGLQVICDCVLMRFLGS